MAEGDRGAVHVDLLQVEIEATRDRDRLRREGFVAFDHVHLLEPQAAFLQRRLRRRDRTFAHDLVGHASYCVGHELGDRFVADLKRPSAIAAAARRCDSTASKSLLLARDAPLGDQVLRRDPMWPTPNGLVSVATIVAIILVSPMRAPVRMAVDR